MFRGCDSGRTSLRAKQRQATCYQSQVTHLEDSPASEAEAEAEENKAWGHSFFGEGPHLVASGPSRRTRHREHHTMLVRQSPRLPRSYQVDRSFSLIAFGDLEVVPTQCGASGSQAVRCESLQTHNSHGRIDGSTLSAAQ